uniref:hypothetical protein n=1 Tax=Herbaspirillum lusitanum TaxID=213312 RepID=UPI0022383B17|nr:hypothetical protein [Herbaspirillum lusitanum]
MNSAAPYIAGRSVALRRPFFFYYFLYYPLTLLPIPAVAITPHRLAHEIQLPAEARAMVANGQMPAQRQPPGKGQFAVLRLAQDAMCFLAVHMIAPVALRLAL